MSRDMLIVNSMQIHSATTVNNNVTVQNMQSVQRVRYQLSG